MEGEFYVEYLGCSSLNKPTTGLGAIQTPLREKYFVYKKSGKGKKTQEVGLKVSAFGIEIIFQGSHPGDPNNQVYDLGSIYICEAVRFTTSKGPDKKLQAGFIPIDNSRIPNTGNEKLFSPLDKKQHSLAKTGHPPIIACVMRRSVGVKAVECHTFVAQSDDIALRICSLVDSLKRRHADQPEPARYEQDNLRNPQRPDLLRTEFGEYGVYRGGSNQNFSDDHFRGNRNSDGWNPEKRRYSGDREADRYIGDNPRSPNQERFGGQYENRRISGDDSRMIHERQRSDEMRPRNGDDDNRKSGDGFNESSAARLGFNYGRPTRPTTREEGQQYRIPRPMSPLRSPGKEPPVPAPKPGRALSPGPFREPSDRQRYSREDVPYSSRDQPYSPDQSYNSRDQPYSSRENPYSPRDQPYSPRDQPYSQRDQPYSPRDKPYNPRDNVPPQGPAFSASNLENREDDEKQKKPVAKVPPHLVAGVKVLPTGFAAPIKKPPSPHDDSRKFIEKEKFYEEEDPYDNAVTRREFYELHGRRNVKSEGDRWKDKPYGIAPPDVLPPEERDRYNEKERLDVHQYRYNDNRQPSPRSNRYSAPPEQTDKPWTFDEQFKKYSVEQSRDYMKSESSHDFRSYHDTDRDNRRPEAEMANMFNQMKVQRDHVNSSEHNFEESLGYFP